MSVGAAAFRDGLERLRALVLERLIELLEHGVPVQKPDAKSGRIAELGRAPAPPAYLSAAIRFLKDNGVVAATENAEDLGALLEDLPHFEENEDDEDEEF